MHKIQITKQDLDKWFEGLDTTPRAVGHYIDEGAMCPIAVYLNKVQGMSAEDIEKVLLDPHMDMQDFLSGCIPPTIVSAIMCANDSVKETHECIFENMDISDLKRVVNGESIELGYNTVEDIKKFILSNVEII